MLDVMSISPGRKYDASTGSYIGGDNLNKSLAYFMGGTSTK